MAGRKKVTTTTEEVLDEASQEPNYTTDIQDKSIAEVATSEPTPEKVAAPVEETKPAEPEYEEIEFDPEEFKKETAQEVKQELAQFLSGKDQQAEDNTDAYEKFRAQFEQASGRQPNWVEVAAFIKDQTKAELIAENQQAYQKYQEQQSQATQNEQTQIAQFNKQIDDELEELYNTGKLTRIVNPNDPNDQGVIERQALFQSFANETANRMKWNEEHPNEQKPPITSISRIFTSYHKRPASQPAGADIIVGGSRSATSSPDDSQELNYMRDVKGGFKALKAQAARLLASRT